ncbi:MAG: carbohydrate ABC transporter permease [Chloroflexi bacterium]|nr:carbohydrate ABC transporter permease [Chloroflexota bacterium]
MTTTSEQAAAAPLAVVQRESLSKRLVESLSKAPIHFALILISVMWLVPSVGLLVTSFRERQDILTSGWWMAFVQGRFTLQNYLGVIRPTGGTDTVGLNFINSLIITIPSTILPMFVASLAAYAFAWLQFRWRDTIFLAIVALLVVPLQMTFVPVLQLYNNPFAPLQWLVGLVGIHLAISPIRLTSSFVGLWLAHTAYGLPLAIYLLRSFFVGLPRDLLEAARIDGSSELRIFARIVLPLSVPSLAALTIFQFLWVWNDFLVALIYAQSPNLQPLTVGLNNMLTTYGPEWDIVSAGAFITMVVPLIVFFSLQKYFVTGILAGAVKT